MARASDAMQVIARRGYVHLKPRSATQDGVWRCADAVIAQLVSSTLLPDEVRVIGEFVVPPPDGPSGRDFQTLHIDFGLPLVPVTLADVARWTALHVPADRPRVAARTRLVPLRGLLADAARSSVPRDELLRRFAAYGKSHGAWENATGYVEGSFARIVEAASSHAPSLPSVRTEIGFQCGLEFATLDDEAAFFARHRLQLELVTEEVEIAPGEMLIFDNLAVAHGRRGRRAPGELYQRIYGHQQLNVKDQIAMRDHWLTSLGW